MADVVRRHLHVTGRVQGVFFRASTRDAARAAGVTGWVRNRPDGSVEAEVQGTPAAVEQVVRFCRVGPAAASVADVTVADVGVLDGEDGFRVR